MPITSSGNICRSKSARICCTRMAPAIEPISVRKIVSFWSLRFTARRRIKYRLAEKEPPTDCSLLVASACAGGTPTASRAGTVSSPPPPAMESINPASSATANNTPSISGPMTNQSMCYSAAK